jgi:hypothetical protein
MTMQDRMNLPKTRVPWFYWAMFLLAIMTVVLTVAGFYIADPMR